MEETRAFLRLLATDYRAQVMPQKQAEIAILDYSRSIHPTMFFPPYEIDAGLDNQTMRKIILGSAAKRYNQSMTYFAEITEFFCGDLQVIPEDDQILCKVIFENCVSDNAGLLAQVFPQYLPVVQSGRLPLEDPDFSRNFMFCQVNDVIEELIYMPYARQLADNNNLSAIEIYRKNYAAMSDSHARFTLTDDPAAIGNGFAFDRSSRILYKFGAIAIGRTVDEAEELLKAERPDKFSYGGSVSRHPAHG